MLFMLEGYKLFISLIPVLATIPHSYLQSLLNRQDADMSLPIYLMDPISLHLFSLLFLVNKNKDLF